MTLSTPTRPPPLFSLPRRYWDLQTDIFVIVTESNRFFEDGVDPLLTSLAYAWIVGTVMKEVGLSIYVHRKMRGGGRESLVYAHCALSYMRIMLAEGIFLVGAAASGLASCVSTVASTVMLTTATAVFCLCSSASLACATLLLMLILGTLFVCLFAGCAYVAVALMVLFALLLINVIVSLFCCHLSVPAPFAKLSSLPKNALGNRIGSAPLSTAQRSKMEIYYPWMVSEHVVRPVQQGCGWLREGISDVRKRFTGKMRGFWRDLRTKVLFPLLQYGAYAFAGIFASALAVLTALVGCFYPMGLFECDEQIEEEGSESQFISAMCQLTDGLLDDLLFNIMTGILIVNSNRGGGGGDNAQSGDDMISGEGSTPAPTPASSYTVNFWTWISLGMSLVMIVKRVLISYYNFVRPFQRYCFEDSASKELAQVMPSSTTSA